MCGGKMKYTKVIYIYAVVKSYFCLCIHCRYMFIEILDVHNLSTIKQFRKLRICS